MERYTLLLNGEDFDTGNYEYFPYVEKAILNFRKTREIIKELKEGRITPDKDEYIYAQYCIGNEDTNRLAIESAYKAFQKFKKFPLSVRKNIFIDLYKLLLKNKEKFINLLLIEGHPRKLAEWEFEGMEIGGRPETIEFFCHQLQKEVGRTEKEILYWARKADGVICASPPGNAPSSNSYLISYVFLTGNTLIIKPPLRDPISTIFLWKEVVNKALIANNVPLGALNIILGNSKKITDEWLLSPLINDIIFFGDSTRGTEIGNKFFQAGKKPILELSGNDIFIAWKDADLDKSTDSLLESFLGSTQICMVPKVALIHESIYNNFVEAMIAKLKVIKASLPSNKDAILSPISKIKDYFDFLNDALSKGARVVYGGQRVNHNNQEDKNGLFIIPTLLEIGNWEKAMTMKCLKEEIFFPLLPLIKFFGNDDGIFEKMIHLVNNHPFGLRASLWISSPKYLRKFAKELDNCGFLRINLRHVGFSVFLSSHGGTKLSGGPFGEMNYLWQRTSHLQGIARALK